MDSKKFLCHLCALHFKTHFSLKRHLRLHEKKDILKSRDPQIICPEDGCSAQFIRYYLLREHIVKEHAVEVEYEELEFKSTHDFEMWRAFIQNETLTEYVKKVQTQVLTNGDHKTFLYCNRSDKGRLIQQTDRKRKLKSQGSKKTGKTCPSMMEIRTKPPKPNGAAGEVFVKFWKTHRGHDFDIAHLRLSKSCKDEIAGKIKSGVPFDNILDDIWDGKIEGPNRLAIMNKKDLHNIVRDYNLSCSTKPHESDAGTVQLLEDEMKELGEDSPFLFFRNQGDECVGFFKHDFGAEVSIQSTELDSTSTMAEMDCSSATTEMDSRSATIKIECTSAMAEQNNLASMKRILTAESVSTNHKLTNKAKLIVDFLNKERIKNTQKSIVEKKLDSLISVLNKKSSGVMDRIVPSREVNVNNIDDTQLNLSTVKNESVGDAVDSDVVNRLVPQKTVNINNKGDKQIRLIFIKRGSTGDGALNRLEPNQKVIFSKDNQLQLVPKNKTIISDNVNSHAVTRLVPMKKVFLIMPNADDNQTTIPETIIPDIDHSYV